MRHSILIAATLIMVAASVATAETPWNDWSSVPPGTEPTTPSVANPNESGNTEVLQFWNDRSAFEIAFPGLTTEDFSSTLVGPGLIEACDPPFNASTNNLCFSIGGIAVGLEINVNIVTGEGQLVVLGTGAAGNTNVLVGPNSFGDDMVLNFIPAVRAAGLDLVNPLTPGQTYTVSIYGTGGLLGTTSAVDGGEGTFWGVDSDDVGGITSIVFEGGGLETNSELAALVIFGGEPVPVELQSIDVE